MARKIHKIFGVLESMIPVSDDPQKIIPVIINELKNIKEILFEQEELIADQEEKIEKVEKKEEELEKEKEELKKETNELEKKIEEKEKEKSNKLAELEKKFEEISKKLDELKKEMENLLKEKEEETEEFEEKIEKALEDIVEHSKLFKLNHKILENLRKELNNLSDSNLILKKSLHDLKKELLKIKLNESLDRTSKPYFEIIYKILENLVRKTKLYDKILTEKLQIPKAEIKKEETSAMKDFVSKAKEIVEKIDLKTFPEIKEETIKQEEKETKIEPKTLDFKSLKIS